MRAASAACMRTSFKVGPTFPLDCSRCCRGRIAENGGRPRWWREPSAIVSRPWSRRRQRCPESMAECAGHCEPLPARGGGSRAVANGVGLAHNPEIAGSNPAPVTRSEARRVCLPGLWMSIANGFVNGGLSATAVHDLTDEIPLRSRLPYLGAAERRRSPSCPLRCSLQGSDLRAGIVQRGGPSRRARPDLRPAAHGGGPHAPPPPVGRAGGLWRAAPLPAPPRRSPRRAAADRDYAGRLRSNQARCR